MNTRRKALFGMVIGVIAASSAVGQPVIYGIRGGTSYVERLDLESGEATHILDGEYLLSLALDPVSNRLYVGGLHILRVDLDDLSVDTVLTREAFKVLHAGRGGSACGHWGLALDAAAQKYYACGECWGGPHLIRANLDGTALEWIDGVHGMDIAIEPHYDARYPWRSKAYLERDERITRFGVAFWEPEPLFELVNASVLRLELDLDAGKVYWVEWPRSGLRYSVWRANLDGSDVEQLVQDTDQRIGIALDVQAGHLYFTDGPLYRANLDGSDVTLVSDRLYREIVIGASVSTSIEPKRSLSTVRLSQNYPNPVTQATTISYALPQAADVTLAVVDVLGREVNVLVSGVKPPGTYDVSFDATRLPSGVYFYSLQAGDYAEIRRMVVVR